MPEIKLKKRIIYSGEVFASLMGRGWGCTEASNFLRECRDADAVEVVHGRWIRHPDDLFPAESTQECSVCHEHEFFTLLNENYCPNCGAKMDGGADT